MISSKQTSEGFADPLGGKLPLEQVTEQTIRNTLVVKNDADLKTPGGFTHEDVLDKQSDEYTDEQFEGQDSEEPVQAHIQESEPCEQQRESRKNLTEFTEQAPLSKPSVQRVFRDE